VDRVPLTRAVAEVPWSVNAPERACTRRLGTGYVHHVHELSVCQAIIDTVDQHAAGRRLRRVSLRIGYLRQVVPDSLMFSWEVLTEGTDLEGCELAVEHVPAVVVCSACHAKTTLEWPVLACERCASADVELLSGEEFLIESMDVVEEVP
jgi:hydrogenase nickel incorporation protein HypA/HybF